MNPLGRMKPIDANDFRQIGEIIQSPTNLEIDGDNSMYFRCDGRIKNRAIFSSEFLRRFNAPPLMTWTARTMAQTPSKRAIAANGTYFVAASLSSATQQLQTSTNGITWSDAVGSGLVDNVNAIVWTGTNFVIKNTGATRPYYAANPTGAFTISSGGTTAVTGNINSMAHAPELGVTLFVPNSVGTTVCTSADNGQTWTDRTTASSKTKSQCCWTGKRFFITTIASGATCRTAQISTDGATWTDLDLPWPVYADGTVPHVSSDGKGTILLQAGGSPLANGYNSYVISKDHGDTWSNIIAPRSNEDGANTSGFTSSANGKFFAANGEQQNRAFYMSNDGVVWGFAPLLPFNEYIPTVWAYKSGVYVGVSGTPNCMSGVEDTTRLQLPKTSRMESGSFAPTGNIGWQEYIKVK